MDPKVPVLSNYLVKRASEDAACFPVDRFFLLPYLGQIIECNKIDFIVYNFEENSSTYSVQLMMCLPEIWLEIEYDNFIEIADRFQKTISYYSLIEFTYKYLEVDIIKILVKRSRLQLEIRQDILDYILSSLYINLVKTDTDFLFFEENVYGVDLDALSYIKQKMLLDPRIEPALFIPLEIKKKVEKIKFG